MLKPTDDKLQENQETGFLATFVGFRLSLAGHARVDPSPTRRSRGPIAGIFRCAAASPAAGRCRPAEGSRLRGGSPLRRPAAFA